MTTKKYYNYKLIDNNDGWVTIFANITATSHVSHRLAVGFNNIYISKKFTKISKNGNNYFRIPKSFEVTLYNHEKQLYKKVNILDIPNVENDYENWVKFPEPVVNKK